MKLCKFCMNEYDTPVCPKPYCVKFFDSCMSNYESYIEELRKCKNCKELFVPINKRNVVCSLCLRVNYKRCQDEHYRKNRKRIMAYQKEYRKKLSTSKKAAKMVLYS